MSKASPGLIKAVEYFRTKKGLAQAIGVEPMTVSQWFKRGLPMDRAKEIHDATDGAITLEELIPQLFEHSGS